MTRILALIIVAALGFYVAWPAYTAFSIKNAIDTNNPQLLASKVDFDAVRVSLKPAVTVEVEKAMTAAVQQGGAENAAVLEQLKVATMPKVIELALTSVVTPEGLLRIHQEGGDARKVIAKIVGEKMGGLGGLGALVTGVTGPNGAGGDRDVGDLLGAISKAAGVDTSKLGGLLGKKPPSAAAPGAAGPVGEKPKIGLANIKGFAMNGPLGLSAGYARDAAASEPDVTVDLGFTGGDWKIVGVRPRV